MDFYPDPGLAHRVDALASQTHQSQNKILNEAVRGYLDWQETFIGRVQQGIDAADRGDFASEDEVNRVFNKYRPT